MSQDLDLNNDALENSQSNVIQDPLELEPEQDPLDMSTKVNKTEEVQPNNKRKNKPMKSSLLLLKCVENSEDDDENNNVDIDGDEEGGSIEEISDEQVDEENDLKSPGELTDNLHIEDEQTNSFESESDYGNHGDQDLKIDEHVKLETLLKLKKKSSNHTKIHHDSNSTPTSNHHSPLSNNAFINNMFTQNYHDAHQASPILNHKPYTQAPPHTTQQSSSSKKQMRFQCRFCVYKSHSVSLMQNHIYRHIDTTPYSCFYCGHKSTTKSTIMVHIELCHPNMEVKIKESRVKEEDYFIDLNSTSNSANSDSKSIELLKENKHNLNKFEIIPNKCQQQDQYSNNSSNQSILPPPPPPPQASSSQLIPALGASLSSLSSTSLSSSVSNTSSASSTASSISSLCSSPSVSPALAQKDENLLLQVNPEHLKNSGFSSDHTFENNDDPNVDGNNKDGNNYVTVFNRPKQYFGSLYEPDKQYSCKLCTYTTNHKPSMEDHVYVHTNKRPYRCGYCDEEIYTRYAATYHNKYKHPGEARNFIKDEQDVSIYYVNRAKGGNSTSNSTSNGSNNTFGSHSTERQQSGNESSNNETEESFHQYGVVAQHRVLDSKQRCSQLNQNSAQQQQNKQSDKSTKKSKQMQSPNSNGSSFSSTTNSPPSAQSNEIKVTSFRTAQSTKSQEKHHHKNKKNENQENPFANDQSQFMLGNQNPFNALGNYFLNNQATFMAKSASPVAPNNNIASALTQFMLTQGVLGQGSNAMPSQQQLPNNLSSYLNAMNPLGQSFSSTTSSPSSSTSTSSSLSTSPSTSNPQQNMYDFNLAIKMYQIQLQNLMAANYLQNFHGGANGATSGKVNSDSKKRKHIECEDNEFNEENGSPQISPIDRSTKSQRIKVEQYNSKKSSKHTV